MDQTTSPSCVTWPSTSSTPRNPKSQTAAKSNEPVGATNSSPTCSLKSEMRLPCPSPSPRARGSGDGRGHGHRRHPPPPPPRRGGGGGGGGVLILRVSGGRSGG